MIWTCFSYSYSPPCHSMLAVDVKWVILPFNMEYVFAPFLVGNDDLDVRIDRENAETDSW